MLNGSFHFEQKDAITDFLSPYLDAASSSPASLRMIPAIDSYDRARKCGFCLFV